MFYLGREGHYFFIDDSGTGPGIQGPFGSFSWILDRAVVNRGPVVPQAIPHGVTHRWRHDDLGSLQLPIFFDGVDGRLGFALRQDSLPPSRRSAAATGPYRLFRNTHEFAPLGDKSTTNIRIAVRVIAPSIICVAR